MPSHAGTATKKEWIADQEPLKSGDSPVGSFWSDLIGVGKETPGMPGTPNNQKQMVVPIWLA